MRAGRLRHRVRIERRSTSRNALGELVRAWTPIRTVSADVREKSAGEGISGDKAAAAKVVEVRLRRLSAPDLSTADRLVYRGRTLAIRSILDPDGRRAEVLVEATELVGE